eukprot:gene17129-20366_t
MAAVGLYGLVEGQECCAPYLGEAEVQLTLSYTGGEEHLPLRDEEPRKRFLGIPGSNRLLAGLLLTQTRLTSEECASRFPDLSSACHPAHPTSSEPYGVDPVFLPTSELYDHTIAPHKCCNISTYTE